MEMMIALGKVSETASRYQLGNCTIIAGTLHGGWAIQIEGPNRLPTEEEIEVAVRMLIPRWVSLVAEDLVMNDPDQRYTVLLKERGVDKLLD
ncbi:MAG: hypothetical protein GX075_07570 [Firmicutes bacterium]|nr:hypothetical protein [Bacillota bacterium]